MRRLTYLLGGVLALVSLQSARPAVAIADEQVFSGGVVVSSDGVVVGTSTQGPPPRDPRNRPATGTATIAGRITDAESGLAIRRVTVMLRAGQPGAEREGRSVATDADGRYVFENLPAGRYVVTATKSGYVNWTYGQRGTAVPAPNLDLADGQTFDRADISLPKGAVITGRVVDEFGEPISDVMVAPLRNQFTATGRRPMMTGRTNQSNDIGEFRLYGLAPGEYMVSATAMRFNGPFDTSTDRTGYAATYYPGTASMQEAQIVRVGPGQVIGGITISMVPTRTARVTGVVVNDQGEMARTGMVSAQPAGGMGFIGASGQVRQDGSFVVNGLAPGTYVLRSMPMMTSPDGPRGPVATATVTVNGEDIDGVRLEPVRPVPLNGRVLLDVAGAQSFAPERVRFTVVSAEPVQMPIGPPPPPEAVRGDRTFTIQAFPGPSTIRAAGLPPGWVITRITSRGVDVTDRIDIPASGIDDLTIELSSRAPVVSGHVANARGEAASDFVALMFPQEEDQWATSGPTRQALGRPDPQGRFTIRTLRPGNYYLIAVDHLDNGQSYDPAFLESIRSSAIRVTLNEGDNQTIDLKLVAPPPTP